MNELNKTRGFSDQFKEVVSLTLEQIGLIDKIELNLHRDYLWNSTSTASTFKFSYIKQIISVLSDDQIAVLREYNREYKLKLSASKKERLQKSLEFQKIRLSSLKLKEAQLLKYVEIRGNFINIYKEKIKSYAYSENLNKEELKESIVREFIYPIFDENQLREYKNVTQEESFKEIMCRIKQEQNTFKNIHNIELSDEQAEQLFKSNNITYSKDSEGQYYSEFEIADLELAKMEMVLNKDQFRKYEKYHFNEIARIRQELIESNVKHHQTQLDQTRKYYQYYITNVLPSKTAARQRIEDLLTTNQKQLISKIREFYFEKLDAEKYKYESQQKRYNLDLVPNELEEYLLRNKLNRINPNIFYLQKYDFPEELMTDKLIDIVSKEENLLQPIYKKLKKFQIESYEASGGSYSGSVMKIPAIKSKQHLKHLSLLLLDTKSELNLNF